jgi:hypothetical protein
MPQIVKIAVKSVSRTSSHQERAEHMSHQGKLIMSMTIMFTICLLALLIQEIISLVLAFDENPRIVTVSWTRFKIRNIFDIATILALYAVLLFCHRFNR